MSMPHSDISIAFNLLSFAQLMCRPREGMVICRLLVGMFTEPNAVSNQVVPEVDSMPLSVRWLVGYGTNLQKGMRMISHRHCLQLRSPEVCHPRRQVLWLMNYGHPQCYNTVRPVQSTSVIDFWLAWEVLPRQLSRSGQTTSYHSGVLLWCRTGLLNWVAKTERRPKLAVLSDAVVDSLRCHQYSASVHRW